MRKVLVLIALFLLAIPAAWIAGQDTELMTMEINSVRTSSFPKLIVTANVYDAQGQPVRGLTRENFAIKGDLAGLVSILDVENVTDDNLPLATVLAIDTSFSMDGTPIVRARDAAQLFVDSLRPNDEVAIVTFGSTTTIVQDFTTDRESLGRAIASLAPAGQTALYQGAFEAVRLAANSPIPRRAVILLSDGAEYGGRSQVTRDAAILEAGPNDVPVYTIGLGFGADRTYLAELSGGTNALFFESPNPDQLDQIYTDLSALFRSQYILTLETGIPGDGREYLLRLQADTEFGGAAAEEIFRVPVPVPIVRILDVPDRLIDVPVNFTIDVLADDELAQVTVDAGDGASPLVDFVSPYSVNIDPQTLAPGPRTFTVRATDDTGDVGEAVFTVEIAALPPIATITNLQPGETLRESRTVTVTYESQTPVVRVNFLLDEADYGQRLSPPYEAPLDVFQLSGGGHILSVIAENAAGVTTRQDIAFSVDETIALTLTALVPTDTPTPTTPPLGTTPGAGDAILPALTGTPATGIPGGGAQATVNAQSTAAQVAAIGTADARATAAQVITNATADAGATADFRSTFEAANAAATENAATSEAEAQATQQQQATAAAVNASTAAAVTAQVQATADGANTSTATAATAQVEASATQIAVSATADAQAQATAVQIAAAATADAQTQATVNAATATSDAATAQALQTLVVEETQVANLQATQTTIAQVAALRQTVEAQLTQDIGATQTANAATQAAASATRAAASATQAAATADAQATLDALATQNAATATAEALATELAATLQALETLAAATEQALATETAAAATQAAQTQSALDAEAAQTAAAATQQALATQQAETQQALATEEAATQAAAATLVMQFTQTAAASATRAAATEQAATQRALATENALASQTALAAVTRSGATEAAQTRAVQATQTAAIIATTAAAPSVTPSITATLQLEEVVTQSPPIPTDLLPLTCVIGLIAGVMAVIFVLIGGSRGRRDRRR